MHPSGAPPLEPGPLTVFDNRSGTFIRRNAAVTLLEILFATLIFSSLIAAFGMVLSSSNKKMTATGNYFFAIQIASKVITDLAEEAQTTPGVLDFLQAYLEMTTHDRVTEGQSVYFRYLVDRKPPFGIIEPGVDGGLSKDLGKAFVQFAPFNVQVTATRKAPADSADYERHIAKITVAIDWKEKNGQARSYEVASEIPSPTGAVPADPWKYDQAALDQRIRERLFPTKTGRTLAAAISETGANPKLVQYTGKIAVITYDLCDYLASVATNLNRLAQARSLLAANPTSKLYGQQMAIAHQTEQAASLIYRTLEELNPSLVAAGSQFSASALPGVDLAEVRAGIKAFQMLPGEMSQWTKDAEEAYEWLLDPRLGIDFSFSLRQRVTAEARLVEAKRFRFATGAMGQPEYLKFIVAQRKKSSGKNPHRERFFLREEKVVSRSTEFAGAFPNLTKVIKLMRDDSGEMGRNVTQILSKLP